MTRREQFIIRQARYLARRNAMYNRGWKWKTATSVSLPHRPVRVTDGRKTPLWNGPKQYRGYVNAPEGYGPILPIASAGLFVWHLIPATHGNPPHVAFDGFYGTYFGPPGNKRLKYAQIGYHRRRVKYVGRKPDRMNGFQRKCWGAGWIAMNEGYFPDWDPLARHPTLAELEAGADPYSGPYPQTPRD